MAKKKRSKKAKAKRSNRQRVCVTVCRDSKGRFQDRHRCG